MTQTAPEISVIIPHFNGEAILRDCLVSLYRSTRVTMEVILVDNGSTDTSIAMVRHEFPQVRILSLAQNIGFAGGCNYGIRNASAPFVLILNNDTVHEKGWIEYLLAAIKTDPSIAVVQPKLHSFQNPGHFDYSGACGGEMDIFGFPFARGRVFEYIEADQRQYDAQPPDIFWASGTAFLARRQLLLEAGLFDEQYFAHMEEIDLDWRLQLMGYRCVIEPRALVRHRSGYTLAAESPFKKYLNHRNSLFMFLSNYRGLLTLYFLPIRLMLEYMAIFFSLLRRDFGRAAAILKAHLWILTHIGKIMRKRQQVGRIRVLRDRQVMTRMYRGSVALSAFLLGKRQYSAYIR